MSCLRNAPERDEWLLRTELSQEKHRLVSFPKKSEGLEAVVATAEGICASTASEQNKPLQIHRLVAARSDRR